MNNRRFDCAAKRRLEIVDDDGLRLLRRHDEKGLFHF